MNDLPVEVKEFLDDLRESGVTNILGAVPYLQEEFGYSVEDASELLGIWMKTFPR